MIQRQSVIESRVESLHSQSCVICAARPSLTAQSTLVESYRRKLRQKVIAKSHVKCPCEVIGGPRAKDRSTPASPHFTSLVVHLSHKLTVGPTYPQYFTLTQTTKSKWMKKMLPPLSLTMDLECAKVRRVSSALVF
jgi:hypothetical protein